ncbi:hypothetical protein EDD22DRAFT_853522 [Suillus occidentalis]|nr:hypothetical protein EDD22DRAFT_853522 [Suillus occidentalis]
MGRSRLHHTPEEKLEAARRYRKRYYDRNRDVISANHKAKYQARQHERSNAIIPQETTDLPAEGLTPTRMFRSQRRHCNDRMIDAEATLTCLINGSSTKLLDRLVQQFRAADMGPWFQSLKTLLENADKLREEVQKYHCTTLQQYGVGKQLRQVELTAGRVTSFTKVSEDVLMHAMSDPHNLLDCYRRGELLYQKTPDITTL